MGERTEAGALALAAPMRPDDRRWLARAIALGETARGISSPNPAVGCVIVVDGHLAGEGATREVGGPHAEVVALGQAGDTARDGTAYVTLEPCAHHGRTPPCTQALLAAGVSRVVIAHPDPNPVAAGGVAELRASGVDVAGPPSVDDPIRATVAAQLEGFLTSVTRERPHVTLKLAQTLDGALTAPTGRWVTGPATRRAVHRWRSAVDAVLVGVGTVLADDPRLDVRHVRTDRQPRPVVVDSRASTPPTAAVVARGALILTTRQAPPERVAALRTAGSDVEVVAARGGRVDLVAALRALRRYGILTVLAEPGAQLAAAMLAEDVVDRFVLHLADHGTGTVVRPALPWPAPPAWRLERYGGAGPDAIVQFVRDPRHVPTPPPAQDRDRRPA